MSNLIMGPGQPPVQPQQRITLKETDLESVSCKCGCEFFIPVLKIKRISRLLTGEPFDRFQPLETVVCLECHTEKLAIENEAVEGEVSSEDSKS